MIHMIDQHGQPVVIHILQDGRLPDRVLPGTRTRFKIQAGALAYRVHRFVLPERPEDWWVHDLYVGSRSQFSNLGDSPEQDGAPGEVFASAAPDDFLRFDTTQAGMNFVIDVAYRGAVPGGAPFACLLSCTAVRAQELARAQEIFRAREIVHAATPVPDAVPGPVLGPVLDPVETLTRHCHRCGVPLHVDLEQAGDYPLHCGRCASSQDGEADAGNRSREPPDIDHAKAIDLARVIVGRDGAMWHDGDQRLARALLRADRTQRRIRASR